MHSLPQVTKVCLLPVLDCMLLPHVYSFIQVIDWEPHRHTDLYDVTRGIWRAGSTEDYAATTAPTGEPVINTMALDLSDPPSSKTRIFLAPTSPLSAYALWQLQKHRRELRKEYLDRWEATAATTGTGRPVDAIIAPIAPYAAPPHGKNL
jgi:amidase